MEKKISFSCSKKKMEHQPCSICGLRTNVVELQCEHNYCLYCCIEMFNTMDSCCGEKISPRGILSRFMEESFPDMDVFDTELSWRQRVDHAMSFSGPKRYFWRLNSSNTFSCLSPNLMENSVYIKKLQEKFKSLTYHDMKKLQREKYFVYKIVEPNLFSNYSTIDFEINHSRKKFLVYYQDSQILFEYYLYKRLPEHMERMLYFRDYYYLLHKIHKDISLRTVEGNYLNRLQTIHGEKSTLLNPNGFVDLPPLFSKLKPYYFGDSWYCSNQSLFQTYRYIHFKDMSIIFDVLNRKQLLYSIYLLFYKGPFQKLNINGLREELISYML